jgi:metal-responsive CopG/Arc/MetJ family transcriptional regulator
MKNRPLSAVLDEIVAAYRQPAKKRLTVRLSDRELAVLNDLASGRPASAALEEVVAAYLQQERLPEHRNRSVKRGSFIINAALLQEVQKMATETQTTASEVIRAALRHSVSNRLVGSSN